MDGEQIKVEALKLALQYYSPIDRWKTLEVIEVARKYESYISDSKRVVNRKVK